MCKKSQFFFMHASPIQVQTKVLFKILQFLFVAYDMEFVGCAIENNCFFFVSACCCLVCAVYFVIVSNGYTILESCMDFGLCSIHHISM